VWISFTHVPFAQDIDVVEGYPFQPLKMKFITKVYHPNISSASGAICLDILTAKAWSPVLTLRSTLVSLRSLLCSPEPNDPQDAEVAAHYKADLAGFESTAKFWTECYAKGLNDRQRETMTAGHADPIAAAGLRKEDVVKFENMVRRREEDRKASFNWVWRSHPASFPDRASIRPKSLTSCLAATTAAQMLRAYPTTKFSIRCSTDVRYNPPLSPNQHPTKSLTAMSSLIKASNILSSRSNQASSSSPPQRRFFLLVAGYYLHTKISRRSLLFLLSLKQSE
jgi:hypothetical protein